MENDEAKGQSRTSNFGERLIDISDNIVSIFDSHRYSYETVRDTESFPFFEIDGSVSHSRRM